VRRPDRFLLARSMAPALVTAKDIMQFDLAGNAVDPRGRQPYLERFIHGSIYKARPDVMAIVHSHSPSIIPFGVTPQKLRPVFHMSGFIGDDVPVWDIHDFSGDTDMLVVNVAQGDDLARTLGNNVVTLMRGHGSVAVGPALQHAVYRAVYAEINARLQADALKLGPVKYLTPDEARLARGTQDKVLGRAYELWARKAGAKR
jgi:ribulose-5-phosphate 4-epimerase/fuculose-1-phosphate aldolase